MPSWHYGARAPIVGGTILDNLTLLSDDFEAEKLNRMLAILGLDKMIAAAENGAAAMLGSKKGGVSGGEKQNIAIVRQMLKSPDVMLFLESTSALDAKSRSALIKLLHEVKRDHIVIVVTHDEEMLAACDEVIPMPGCLSGRGVEGQKIEMAWVLGKSLRVRRWVSDLHRPAKKAL